MPLAPERGLAKNGIMLSILLWRRASLLALLALSACGDHHPLSGNWNQELPGGKAGMHLSFDTKGTNMEASTPPRADGSHDHVRGTYTFDAATKALTVKLALLGADHPDSWSGKVEGEHIELEAGTTKLVFHRGAHAH